MALIGIEPSRIDEIALHTARPTVERLVEGVQSERACPAGAEVTYVYSRGRPAHRYAPLAAAYSIGAAYISVGLSELARGYCEIACARGLLVVTYDGAGRLLDLRAEPTGYDAGAWCESGKQRYQCEDIRDEARVTDPARSLPGDAAEIDATGCRAVAPGAPRVAAAGIQPATDAPPKAAPPALAVLAKAPGMTSASAAVSPPQ